MREPNSEERPQPEEGLEQTLGQDERILVVDDEDTIRTVISELLREEGHEVVDVPSGEVALEAFREKPFPLVIPDIVMGKMTGIELMVEL